MSEPTPLTIDFESYFDKDVNLEKLSTLEYVRHPKFKVHGAAVKLADEPARWMIEDDLWELCCCTNWQDTRAISHNSNFDLLVLHEKYRVFPHHRVDTLGLCRALLNRDTSFALDDIGPILGLGTKHEGGAALQAVKGIENPTPEQLAALGHYAVQDAEMCYGLYKLLWPLLPEHERTLMNQVLRFSTQGVFERDDIALQALTDAKQEIEDYRKAKLAAAGCTIKELKSREGFAQLLRAAGVQPPTKISPANGKTTYAFAKGDSKFVRLKVDPRVGHLVEARMAFASNNALTRIDRLQNILNAWPHTLPAQLNYNGAHTGRFSGGGKINMQNLNARGLGSGIRRGLRVRDGYTIVVLDLSAVELRMNMWFCKQNDVLELLRQGIDVYTRKASESLKIPEDDITPLQRFLSKVKMLAAQYGMGAPKFREYMAAGPFGSEPLYLDGPEAHTEIQNYRAAHPQITAMWRWLNDAALPHMTLKDAKPLEYKCVKFGYEHVELPNGMRLTYPNLRGTEEGFKWGQTKTQYIWGGTLLENIIQALAGIVVKEQMLEIDAKYDGEFFLRTYQQSQLDDTYSESSETLARKAAVIHQVHDEILTICRCLDADYVLNGMSEIMTRPPSWAPDLPLAVEGGYDQGYSK